MATKKMANEIVIAGAGVSGLTAAINLKRAGHSVLVIERNSMSGAQRFPDWDAVENWTSPEDLPQFLERISVDDSRFQYAGRSSFTVIDPHGRRYDIQTARPFFYLIKRGAVAGGLEHGLQAQAEAMGIPIEYGTVCSPGQADIWAAGPISQAADYISVGFTFHTDHPDWVCGIVDKNIAPRAYAYLVIIGGEGTLAVLLSEARREANQLLERAVGAFQQHADHEIRPLVHASLVNRWLYNHTPNWGYALLMRYFAHNPDLHTLMSRWYHPRRIHRLLWPLVSGHFQRLAAARASQGQYRDRTRAWST